jgi:hypothetical protein
MLLESPDTVLPSSERIQDGAITTRLGRSWIIEDMSSDGANFFVANPGYGKPFTRTLPDGSTATYNPQTLTTVDPATGRTIAAQVPKPERKYDAITVSLTKNFSKNWLAHDGSGSRPSSVLTDLMLPSRLTLRPGVDSPSSRRSASWSGTESLQVAAYRHWSRRCPCGSMLF